MSLTLPALEEEESRFAWQLVPDHSKTAPRTVPLLLPAAPGGGGMRYPRQPVCEGVRHSLKYTTETSAELSLFVK